jgi:hypothetical protein
MSTWKANADNCGLSRTSIDSAHRLASSIHLRSIFPAIRTFLFGLVLVVMYGSAHPQDRAAATVRQAGTIELAEGDAIIDPKAGAPRFAKAGGIVNEGDTITTFAAAEVHLRMADAAHLSIRENSKLTISSYVADGGNEDNSLIELAKGSIRAITGWIGKLNRRNYAIRTPTVTIGIRGTDHEPMHLLSGDPRGEPGTYDKVNEGGTSMRSEHGTVDVTPNHAAFHGSVPGARPRLLQSIPAFFKPARSEQRFVQRARETAPTIDKLRDARVQAVRAEREKGSKSAPTSIPNKAMPANSARPDYKGPVAAPASPNAKVGTHTGSQRTDQRPAEKRASAATKVQVKREATQKPAAPAQRKPASSKAPHDVATKAHSTERKHP